MRRPPADPVQVKRNGGLSPGELLVWHYDKPLIVLEYEIPLTLQGPLAVHSAEFNKAVDDMARDLAARSPRGQLRIAITSGHEIMLDEPMVVIEAVHDVRTEALTPGQKDGKQARRIMPARVIDSTSWHPITLPAIDCTESLLEDRAYDRSGFATSF